MGGQIQSINEGYKGLKVLTWRKGISRNLITQSRNLGTKVRENFDVLWAESWTVRDSARVT